MGNATSKAVVADVGSAQRAIAPPVQAAQSRSWLPGNQSLLRVQRKCSCGGSGCSACSDDIQKKMRFSPPGDRFEQEADSVAERVMRMPDRVRGPGPEPGLIQLSRVENNRAGLSEAPPVVQDVLRSSGQPLDQGTRSFMESRFAHDFGRIRIHQDRQAADSAMAIGAQAYAFGSDVVFGEGQYRPGTVQGNQLLAHELVHTIQQGKRAPHAGGVRQTGVPAQIARKPQSNLDEMLPKPDALRVSATGEVLTSHSLIHWAVRMRKEGQDVEWMKQQLTGSHEFAGSDDQRKRAAADLDRMLAEKPLNAWAALIESEVSGGVRSHFFQRNELAAPPAIIQTPKGPDVGPVRQQLANIEKDWKILKDVAKEKGVSDWVATGDIVVGAIREHAKSAIAALQRGESAQGQVAVLKADLLEYRYIFSHTVLYQTLGSIDSWIDGLATSIKADDRKFTNRKMAEAIVSSLKKLIVFEAKHSQERLSTVQKIIEDQVQHRKVIIRESFRKETEAAFKLEMTVEVSVEFLNQFLHQARVEGAQQATEAVVEFYLVRAKLKGASEESKSEDTSTDTEPGTGLDVQPIPYPQPGDDEKRKCRYPTGLSPLDPISIEWYKPKVDDWYPPQIELPRLQHSYSRDEVTRLPNGEPIGVARPRWPSIGKIVQLAPDCGVPRSSTICPAASRFRAVLIEYGFVWGDPDGRAGHRYLQADHVQDVQWADPLGEHLDQFTNLWPMDGAANNSAGSLQNLHQVVHFCDTPNGNPLELPMREVMRRARAGEQFYGRFFQITRIDRGPALGPSPKGSSSTPASLPGNQALLRMQKK